MRVYGSDNIRNVAVIGHGASGKTALVDALAFVAGSSKRHGSVPDGTALTDYTPDEIERQYSISLGLAHAEWMDSKINLIDAPGYLDFTGDALAAVYAADAAVITVGATAGVEAGTELVWQYTTERGMPCLFVASMMDKENANFEDVLAGIKKQLTASVVPIQIPVGEGAEFKGIIDLFSKKCHMFTPGTKTGEYEEVDVPAECQDRLEEYSQQLIEDIAATDEALMERYFEGEEISRDEMLAALKAGMAKGEVFPLLCCSSQLTYGTRNLLSELVALVPSPVECPPVAAKVWEKDSELNLEASDDGPVVARIFKTVAEPHVGEVSLFKIVSGKMSNGSELYNAPREMVEKLNHLSVAQGKDRTEVPELHAGDIGVVAKLKDTHTNDTLSTQGTPIALSKIPFPEPIIVLAVAVTKRGEEDKLVTGLQKLHDEDPTFHHEFNPELRQTLISGRGARHLEVIVSRLERKYGVHSEIQRPLIAYRETFKKKGQGQGRHKKQSGGRGQFGDCWIRIEPLPRGSGYEFKNSIVGGSIPSKYIPAVDRGVQEASARGVLSGSPVVDFRVDCYDGSFHAVDSSEQAFKMAGVQAFRNVSANCRPIILEPIHSVEVWTPDENLGDVMGDLSSRRGQILGSEPDRKMTKVMATVPESEMYRYSTQLHSMTHGRGTFAWKFHSYQEVPAEVAETIAEERKKAQEEAAK
jgi:elongation factor G